MVQAYRHSNVTINIIFYGYNNPNVHNVEKMKANQSSPKPIHSGGKWSPSAMPLSTLVPATLGVLK